MATFANRSLAFHTLISCLGLSGLLLAQTPPQPAAPQWVTAAANVPRVQHRTFDSMAAGTTVSFHVYVPAIYDKEPTRRFPVMYWLHGSAPSLPPGLVTNVDGRIGAGTLPPFLIVFPNGLVNSMWVDSKDGRVPMETVVIKELLPHIDATFRTIASSSGRLIEGVSMGGYGAARLGFKFHELFGAVSIISGGPLQQVFEINETPRATPAGAQAVFNAVWGGDQEYFTEQSPWTLAERNATRVREIRIRQIVGDRDNVLDNNRKFDAHLGRLKIPHTFTVLPGVGHGDLPAIARALGEEFFAFYRDAWSSEAARPK